MQTTLLRLLSQDSALQPLPSTNQAATRRGGERTMLLLLMPKRLDSRALPADQPALEPAHTAPRDTASHRCACTAQLLPPAHKARLPAFALVT
eukprot:3802190-Prymnesium_polylepis.3